MVARRVWHRKRQRGWGYGTGNVGKQGRGVGGQCPRAGGGGQRLAVLAQHTSLGRTRERQGKWGTDGWAQCGGVRLTSRSGGRGRLAVGPARE
jgi:hypothetical protein